MNTGTSVEVYNGFTEGWTRGFVVHGVVENGHGRLYQVRRVGDAIPLASLFETRRVREDPRGNGDCLMAGSGSSTAAESSATVGPTDREISAVLAHGLLSTTMVLSGSAYALQQFGEGVTDGERTVLLEAMAAHATLLDEGLHALIRHCSGPFADAATAVALAARGIAFVPAADLPGVLDGLNERLVVVAAGLQSLVRGLPQEVVALLDSLSH